MKSVGKTAKKKTSPNVTVSSGSVEAFIWRSLERARMMDRGKTLPSEITMTFENPADLVRVLSGSECESSALFAKSRRPCQNSLRHSAETGKQ